MPFSVSVADIENRWRPLTSDEADVASFLLQDADLKLRLARNTLEAFVTGLTAGQPKTDLLNAITIAIVEAVKRVLRNPDLLRSQTIGPDGGVGIGFETDPDIASSVYISNSDLSTIDAAVGAAEGTVEPQVVSRVLTSTWPWRTSGDSSTLPTP